MPGVIVGKELPARILILQEASRRWKKLRTQKCVISIPYMAYSTNACQESHNHDNFTRGLCGALAQFECGAQVSKISFPADFSAARIIGLPVGISPDYVSTLFSEIGIRIPPNCVRVFGGNGPQTSADIRLEDPTFSKLVCAKIDARSTLGPSFSHLQASPIPISLSSDSNACRVECRKVQCSWYKPSKTAWLNFGSEDIAKRVFNNFTFNRYRILGQTVHCNAPIKGEGGRRNPYAWTLMLTGLPIATTEKNIRFAIHSPQDSPRNIELGKPSYNVDGETASATVMSLLSQVGPIEWSQANTELEGKRAKAIARFYEEADAREAARTLHDRSLSFGTNMKLTVQLVSTAKFKVAATIFSAVQSRIRTASEAWKKEHLTFKIYPSTGFGFQYRVLKIEGLVAKDVATAKETMNEILDGITIMRHGKPLWAPSLNLNGNSFQKLKKFQQDHGVIVIRNRSKKELKLYGSPEKCVDVESAIVRMISDESSTNYVINLSPECFQWACNGGFQTIVRALGDNIATFDIVSTPKRILIEGSEKNHETALKLVKKREYKVVTETSTEKDCAVCWTPAENAVFTKCSHVYCIECFENLCTAAGSGEKYFSIKCLGDMGKCQVVFGLEELQENLSSKAFEDTLEASFASYIQRHPQMFRYCPIPDCSMIYRANSTMKFNTCAKCLTVTCTFCHAPHEGKTCAEYKDEVSGGYQATQKLKKELGIKDCPRCMTPLEKTEGCNHMKCRGCGAHLCWVCLEVFSTDGPCYDHMRAKHGVMGWIM